MAFALTGFEAFPIVVQGAQPRRAIQRVVLHATGTTSDVDLDIGDNTGTFWGAADSTDLGAAALADLQAIVAQSSNLCYVYCPQIDAAGVRVGGTATVAQDLTSAATAGTTGATRTLTVAGLLTTDNITGFDIVEDGAVPVSVVEAAKTCAVAGQYIVTFSADPEVGLEGRVSFTRSTASAATGTDYTLSFENDRPNWTFAASQGLTAYTIFLDYHLDVNVLPFVKTYGIGA